MVTIFLKKYKRRGFQALCGALQTNIHTDFRLTYSQTSDYLTHRLQTNLLTDCRLTYTQTSD
jgi:hypothetical protein